MPPLVTQGELHVSLVRLRVLPLRSERHHAVQRFEDARLAQGVPVLALPRGPGARPPLGLALAPVQRLAAPQAPQQGPDGLLGLGQRLLEGRAIHVPEAGEALGPLPVPGPQREAHKVLQERRRPRHLAARQQLRRRGAPVHALLLRHQLGDPARLALGVLLVAARRGLLRRVRLLADGLSPARPGTARGSGHRGAGLLALRAAAAGVAPALGLPVVP
mmetsp:Transcript_9696/g.20030  ORF Transcript_9696/g.20030 Transcript_9696/m.20030 type:complete len:218 (+) Transcript_9696:187-840(+)